MKCDWVDTGKRRRDGEYILYMCARAGCGRHALVKAGDDPASVPRRCRHPALLEPGEVVHHVARVLGFKECGRCRRRREAWNNRFSVPVPNWFYSAVKSVIGKSGGGDRIKQTERVVAMLKRRNALMPTLAPIQQAIKEKQAVVADLRKQIADASKEVAELKSKMRTILAEGLSDKAMVHTDQETGG